MKRSFLLMGAAALCAAACSATNDGSAFGNDQGSGGSGGADTTTGSSQGQGGDISVGIGVGGTTGSGPSTCNHPMNEDGDGDGFTGADGDCNDCDLNVNPGAIEVIVTEAVGDGGIPEPADEDCDMMVDNVVLACDMGLAVDDLDPMNGARAIDLCSIAAPDNQKWGVLSSAYVRADGTPIATPAQVGIQQMFGTNVNAQGGERMLALSSGWARTPGQPGECVANSCYTSGPGIAPPGFPQDTGGCIGSTQINDDIGLELKIRTPKNSTGYSFNFSFYSFEYPEWVCTSYNDQFIALVTPPPAGSLNGNISFDSNNNPVSVNIAFFQVCAGCALGTNDLMGTGFDGTWGDDAGATGWLQTQAPVTGGEEITVRFAIWDTGDQAWDSTVLIDNFRWIANGGTVTVGTEPVPIPK